MNETNRNYSEIERPYDTYLNRSYSDATSENSDSSNNDATSEDSTTNNSGATKNPSGGSSDGNGSVENQPVKSDGGMGDIWIVNQIKSASWKPKKVGFYINGQTGYAEFTDVYVSGNIEALTGHIGGFLIGADYVRDEANSFGLSSTVTAGDDVRFWAGDTYTNRAIAPFRVTEAGVVTAISGTIGGNVLTSTTISSTTFVSGPLGSGWQISNTGTAEFQDVTIRGIIRTSVFEKDTISAINGLVLISKADVLDTDMTALDASTLVITGETTFVNNEVIRIKDGTDDEWMLVTDASGAPTYVVTRDLAGSYSANSNPIWTKGTAVVSMGVGTGTKTGFILLDSSSANSPYIDVYGRNSNTYSDYTLRGRFGWLKGITDADVGLAATDVWGLYSDSVYLKGAIVATSGKFGTTTNYWSVGATGLTAVSASGDVIINYGKTDFGQDSTAGFILGYDFSASKAKIEFGASSTKYFKYDGTDLSLIGGIIQTGTTGQRIVMSSSDNTLRFYDSVSQMMGIGTTASVAIRMDLSTTTANGVQIVGPNTTSIGFSYSNSNNVVCQGLRITQTGTTNNTAPAIYIQNSGSGEGLYIENDGTGYAIQIARTTGSGAVPQLKLLSTTSTAFSSQLVLVQATNSTATGTMVDFGNDGRGITLNISSTYNSSVPCVAITSASNSASGPTLQLNRTGDQTTLEILQTTNSGNNNIGIRMAIANAGAGIEYAFEFAGSEYDGSKTGVSGLTGVIKIQCSDGLSYIPVYSSTS